MCVWSRMLSTPCLIPCACIFYVTRGNKDMIECIFYVTRGNKDMIECIFYVTRGNKDMIECIFYVTRGNKDMIDWYMCVLACVMPLRGRACVPVCASEILLCVCSPKANPGSCVFDGQALRYGRWSCTNQPTCLHRPLRLLLSMRRRHAPWPAPTLWPDLWPQRAPPLLPKICQSTGTWWNWCARNWRGISAALCQCRTCFQCTTCCGDRGINLTVTFPISSVLIQSLMVFLVMMWRTEG